MLIRLTLQRSYDGYAYHYFCKYEHATSTRNENCDVVTLALLVEPLHITVIIKRLPHRTLTLDLMRIAVHHTIHGVIYAVGHEPRLQFGHFYFHICCHTKFLNMESNMCRYGGEKSRRDRDCITTAVFV